MNDQDPLHTIKTEFDLQPRNPVNFSQAGIHSAQHGTRKKRINHHGTGGGYLSEAVDGPSVAERKPRSNTQNKNNTLSNKFVNQPEEKVRAGSLSYANHKYNQSASGIKRGSTAPGGNNNQTHVTRGDLALSYNKGGGPHEQSSTIQGGTRHQYNMSSDM